ncbi:hypothetical protein D0Z00_000218 [Geotrichum galactomycetum]|uniref:Uncharacterized protein n=1 Tax=Geotrichum galactomycetum TaxID=27317 RepID=A0ACB6VAC8_9ASCO|nr:hypothetical protein D0Z00_000218 [Geotrichum candidum]
MAKKTVVPAPANRVDGKTRVKEAIAELQVRGEIGDASEPVTKSNNGITIRSKKSNKIRKQEKRESMVSWKKRKRQAEAIERAENLKDMFNEKVGKSLERFKRTNDRKKGWEETNKKINKMKNENKNIFSLLDVDNAGGNKDDDEWSDEGMAMSD